MFNVGLMSEPFDIFDIPVIYRKYLMALVTVIF